MKLLIAFLKLIRWPNLFFIALTQFLFYHCIVLKLPLTKINVNSFQIDFHLLILASILIAAAGYIINDYFDLQIDNINKPEKVVVDTIIKRRWAIMWHWILSATGILLSAYISIKISQWSILIFNSFCVLALWFYSTHFKKKLLIGNILISLLTAWTIIVVYLFSGASLFNLHGWQHGQLPFDVNRLYKFTMLYAGFAFIITLIREVVKDIEDMHGDVQFGCKTMPIVWGIPASKVFAAVWIIVCSGALTVIQLYAWQNGFRFSVAYVVLLIIAPLLLMIKNLYHSETAADYHKISNQLKLIMLAGILSILFL
jgi:4-hydroxybenzoate polyprenyltransferase